MSPLIIKSTFHGPYCWFSGSKFPFVYDSEYISSPGIYLWAVPYQSANLAYYIGETGAGFGKRMESHAKNYFSGVYRIYEPEKFLQGEKEIIWRGAWQKETSALWPEFLSRYSEITPVLIEFLSTMKLFLAPISVEARIRKRIEGALARSLMAQPLPVGTFQETEIRYAQRKRSEAPITVIIQCLEPILGLPSQITA